jgi:UDP-glucose 4-epimerase
LKVLVTGGSGFLGPNICDILVKEGDEVISFDLKHPERAEKSLGSVKAVRGDVTSFDSIVSCLRENPVEGIIAAAAKILGDQEEPLGTFRVNVLGLANVLEAARKTGVKRVVFTSTAGVYGKRGDSGPLREDLSMRPEDTYEHTKMVAEYWAKTYRDRYSTDVRVVRFPFLYGPRQYAVWPLNIVLYHALVGSRLHLTNGGDYPLEYLHVRDAAEGVVRALKAETPIHTTFNIGTGTCNKVDEIAGTVKKLFPSFEYDIGPGLWPSEMLNSWVRGPLDISRARDELGYRPHYQIGPGIEDLASWEKSYPDEYLSWPKNALWIL